MRRIELITDGNSGSAVIAGTKEPDSPLRANGLVGQVRTLGPWTTLAKDKRPGPAARGRGHIGKRGTVTIGSFVEMLQDEDGAVRWLAASVLGQNRSCGQRVPRPSGGTAARRAAVGSAGSGCKPGTNRAGGEAGHCGPCGVAQGREPAGSRNRGLGPGRDRTGGNPSPCEVTQGEGVPRLEYHRFRPGGNRARGNSSPAWNCPRRMMSVGGLRLPYWEGSAPPRCRSSWRLQGQGLAGSANCRDGV